MRIYFLSSLISDMEKCRITAAEDVNRADTFIAGELGITRSAAQRLISEGLAVSEEGGPIKKNYSLTKGESLFVRLPDVTETETMPEDIPLDVVYEDADVIVVNKPRGMVTHPAPGHAGGTLVNALLSHCRDSLSGIGGKQRPGIVHRLDKDTSGLIIAAKNDAAHLSLSAQLKARTLKRGYEAVVHGNVKDDAGLIDAPIGRHPTHRKRMAVTYKNSKPAVTRYEVVARYDGCTHVRCELETGRTHQIRVHMAHIGHPLLGDSVYGGRRGKALLDGQCLHAKRLRFIHPRTGEAVELSCELPEYFAGVLKSLR